MPKITMVRAMGFSHRSTRHPQLARSSNKSESTGVLARAADYRFMRLSGFHVVTTRAIFFPFDLFGTAGSKAGAELLADAFQEMLADNKRERIATRARAYANKVRFEEFAFETLADYHDWRGQARARIRQVFTQSEFLLWVTGNHLGTLPVY